MFHSALPFVLSKVRELPDGESHLNDMKFVSKEVSRMGKATEELYDAQVVFFRAEMHNLITSNRERDTYTLIAMQEQFRHEESIQKELLRAIMYAMGQKNGQHWKCNGSEAPAGMDLFGNDGLHAALSEGRTTFSPVQWKAFHVPFLAQKNCVQVGTEFFMVDVARIHSSEMAPVEVLHDIALFMLDTFDTDRYMVESSLQVLESLHRTPWKEEFADDTYDAYAIRALKLVALAMQRFPKDLDLQQQCTDVCGVVCMNIGSGATHKLINSGGHDILEGVLAAMLQFPDAMSLQLSCLKLIILDAEVLPGEAAALHPNRRKYRDSLFVDAGVMLVDLGRRCDLPVIAKYTCRSLEALLNCRIFAMTAMKEYVEYLMFCLDTWNDGTPIHYEVRNSAMNAMISYFQARDKVPFTDVQNAAHRVQLHKSIAEYDTKTHTVVHSDVLRMEWVGQRVLSYLCAYRTVPYFRRNSVHLRVSLEFLTELCIDNNASRERFIYDSSGISTCFALGRDFAARGTPRDMQVVDRVVDLLESLYFQHNDALPPAVDGYLLQTAGMTCFSSAAVHDIAVQGFAATTKASEGRRLTTVDGGTTVIGFLQELLQTQLPMLVPQYYILETCLRILRVVCVLPENARLVDTSLITAIAMQYANDDEAQFTLKATADILSILARVSASHSTHTRARPFVMRNLMK